MKRFSLIGAAGFLAPRQTTASTYADRQCAGECAP
jgi:hypothetical protein